ncbi:MAG: hypothetical protein COB16_09875 [Rhodobacteraceae bacterium]|nr:MAG: hypothetical protein COB16_09875 [Paracoccaceae bacterium]
MPKVSLVSLLFVVTVFWPQTVLSQTRDPEGDTGGYSGNSDEHDGPGDEGRSGLRHSDQVVARLNSISALCEGADIYVIDCLAERLETLEREMSGLVGFGDARRIFRDTAAQLRAITQNNLDPNQPRARMQSRDGRLRSARPLTAVTPARKRQAISQAVAVLAEAETQLLRSGEASSRRAVQYQQIAAALGSNKVLLRSV